MKKLIIILFLFFPKNIFPQSATGTSGLINIPSARMLDDGKIIIGAAYIPKPYFQRYNRKINSGLNSYITFGVLPFIEVMFRYTHELNVPVNTNTQYFPDRMFKIRARIFKEKKYFPATVIGVQDLSAFIAGTCER